jgi:hypothetical protein
LKKGTASYFMSLGLVGDDADVSDDETNINFLFETALFKVAFLPFAYLVSPPTPFFRFPGCF